MTGEDVAGRPFDDLIAEADAAPVDGWDVAWLHSSRVLVEARKSG